MVLDKRTRYVNIIYRLGDKINSINVDIDQVAGLFHCYSLISSRSGGRCPSTVLPAKSDSDVMFC